MRKAWIPGIAVLVSVFVSAIAWAATYDSILNRWTKTRDFADRGDSLSISATYYSAEFIEATIQQEADRNLWTADELERYKYQFLKTLNVEDTIPVKLSFDNRGAALHMAPFGKQVWLWIGGKRYEPKDYDPRLNMRVMDKIEGLVYFPRFDEKTGKDLLKGVKSVKLEISGSISMTLRAKTAEFVWDVANDNPERLFAGKAGAKLEMDRLIRRLEKLNGEKKDLEGKLEQLKLEIEKIQARMNELQKQ
ncbi:MAG: hypothetical protein GX436_05265 [Synergistaceae bacterium]|nr:hypothetical protein [Synergistaceae bacterium]